MIYLVTYDIEDDKRRKKISDRLLADGLLRIQYSVFMGPLTDPLLDRLNIWLDKKIEESEGVNDSIIILKLPYMDEEKMAILGKISFDIEEVLDLKHTLFL